MELAPMPPITLLADAAHGLLGLVFLVRLVLPPLRDRAEHKRGKLPVEESEARLRAFIDNAPDPISLQDGQGRFVLVNRQFAKLYGGEPEQLIGKTVADLVPADEAASIAATDRWLRETGRVSRREVVGPDNRSLMVTTFPIAAHDGAPALIGTIISDVTEFRRLREQLHHAQKLETVGQLTGGIAHDFNNLLTVIQGSADMLRRPAH
jgi:PAS domain S-box-containing protein